MAFSTTPEETLKYYLFKVMSEEDATRFMSLKEALAACEEPEPKWQAIYALSAHLHVLASYKTGIEFGEYVDKHAVGFDDLLRILALARSKELGKKADDYKQRVFNEYLLRPSRLGMSLLDKLHKDELEYTPWWFLMAVYNGQFFSFYRAIDMSKDDPGDSDIYKETISEDIDPERYTFVGYGKLMAANTLIPMLLKQSDYEAAVGSMTKVAECLPTEEVFAQLDELVDKWLNVCESIPLGRPATTKQAGALDNGEYQWVSLVDSVAAITGLAGDMTVESIDRCFEAKSLAVADKYSEDFWAWKYGYIVGRLALAVRPVLQRGEMPLRDYGLGDRPGDRDDWHNGLVVYSLLSGCDPATDYFPMWLPADGHQYLTEVAPTSGLYWAMRIGFAEAMLKERVAIVPPISPIEKLDKIETITSSSFQWQIKGFEEMKGLLQAVTSRLPPSPEEIESYLLETLDDTFDRLPLPVIDHLKQAEIDFKSGTRQSNARIEFVKSVEAALDCLFVSPLKNYYKQYKLGWPFIAPSPDGAKNEYGIRKWGEYFCKLAQPGAQQLGAVNTPSINHFLKEYYPNLNYCELEGLGKSLQDVQKLRGVSAHYQSQFPLHKEVEKLKELRKMVLGLEGRPSIIKQMVELFGSKKDTA